MDDVPTTSPPTGFEERQRFRQPALILVVVLLGCGVVLTAVLVARQNDTSGAVWVTVLVGLAVGLVVPAWVLSLEMVTTVEPAGLRVRFAFGFATKRFAVGDMTDVRSVTYHPMREFGGWGVRWGRGGARAYNVSGNRGVELHADGRRWVIGSQQPDELAAALEAIGVPPAPIPA